MNEIVNLGNGQFVKVCMLKGQQGDNIQSIAKTSTSGLVDTYTITLTDGSTQTFTVTNGKSIVSIEKTDTSGLVDTYTITFNDNTTQTFTVTNGNGIVSIEKTSTVGLVDTYTITLNSGSPVTFTVTNGKGISSIAKTSTSGLVDTYTITYNDNTTSTFDVTNGANGQDVSQSNLAPVETGNTASQSYVVGEHLVWNGVYYKVIQAIASGGSFNVGVNLRADTVASDIEYLEEFHTYSTSEKAVGKWIDGRTLYERTFYKDLWEITSGATSSQSYTLGDLNTNGELLIVNITGSVKVNYNHREFITQYWRAERYHYALVQKVGVDGVIRMRVTFSQVYQSTSVQYEDIVVTVRYVK